MDYQWLSPGVIRRTVHALNRESARTAVVALGLILEATVCGCDYQEIAFRLLWNGGCWWWTLDGRIGFHSRNTHCMGHFQILFLINYSHTCLFYSTLFCHVCCCPFILFHWYCSLAFTFPALNVVLIAASTRLISETGNREVAGEDEDGGGGISQQKVQKRPKYGC